MIVDRTGSRLGEWSVEPTNNRMGMLPTSISHISQLQIAWSVRDGDVHAQQTVFTIEMRRTQLYKALLAQIKDELLVLQSEPDAAWLNIAKMITT